MNGEQLSKAISGDFVTINLNISSSHVKHGFVIGDMKNDWPSVYKTFTAQLIITSNVKRSF